MRTLKALPSNPSCVVASSQLLLRPDPTKFPLHGKRVDQDSARFASRLH